MDRSRHRGRGENQVEKTDLQYGKAFVKGNKKKHGGESRSEDHKKAKKGKRI